MVALLPLEFFDYARSIASFVDRVIEEDPRIIVTQGPWFCIKLDLKRNWILVIKLPSCDVHIT